MLVRECTLRQRSRLILSVVKYTNEGGISVSCHRFVEPFGLRKLKEVAVEIVVADTGRGIDNAKLESIFREFEQIESSVPKAPEVPGLGMICIVYSSILSTDLVD